MTAPDPEFGTVAGCRAKAVRLATEAENQLRELRAAGHYFERPGFVAALTDLAQVYATLAVAQPRIGMAEALQNNAADLNNAASDAALFEEAATDRRPHSRACGLISHPHGPACKSDCPTCWANRNAARLQWHPK